MLKAFFRLNSFILEPDSPGSKLSVHVQNNSLQDTHEMLEAFTMDGIQISPSKAITSGFHMAISIKWDEWNF